MGARSFLGLQKEAEDGGLLWEPVTALQDLQSSLGAFEGGCGTGHLRSGGGWAIPPAATEVRHRGAGDGVQREKSCLLFCRDKEGRNERLHG